MKKRFFSAVMSIVLLLGTLSMAFAVYSFAESTDSITTGIVTVSEVK
ncbi:MAG: hypothetical protein KBT31_02310 [Firmicutes bacterium]|nr:hypothetical protein [Candidatus Colimorpha enterica]